MGDVCACVSDSGKERWMTKSKTNGTRRRRNSGGGDIENGKKHGPWTKYAECQGIRLGNGTVGEETIWSHE